MKPRARRVTLAAAVLGVGVVGVVAVINWRAVRDHMEAWNFQLANKTTTILPDPDLTGIPVTLRPSFQFEQMGRFTLDPPQNYAYGSLGFLHALADHAGCPVILASRESAPPPIPLGSGWIENVTSNKAKVLLEAAGYRVLEQRFPRRAYVVIRDQGSTR